MVLLDGWTAVHAAIVAFGIVAGILTVKVIKNEIKVAEYEEATRRANGEAEDKMQIAE